MNFNKFPFSGTFVSSVQNNILCILLRRFGNYYMKSVYLYKSQPSFSKKKTPKPSVKIRARTITSSFSRKVFATHINSVAWTTLRWILTTIVIPDQWNALVLYRNTYKLRVHFISAQVTLTGLQCNREWCFWPSSRSKWTRILIWA